MFYDSVYFNYIYVFVISSFNSSATTPDKTAKIRIKTNSKVILTHFGVAVGLFLIWRLAYF